MRFFSFHPSRKENGKQTLLCRGTDDSNLGVYFVTIVHRDTILRFAYLWEVFQRKRTSISYHISELYTLKESSLTVSFL